MPVSKRKQQAQKQAEPKVVLASEHKAQIDETVNKSTRRARRAPRPERVDVVITFTRVGTHKTMVGEHTGDTVYLFAVTDTSYSVDKDGNKTMGVDIRDATALEDTSVPFYCPRTEEWCTVKPFRIVK